MVPLPQHKQLDKREFEEVKEIVAGIRTTTEVVVCTDPRRVITGLTPKGALKV